MLLLLTLSILLDYLCCFDRIFSENDYKFVAISADTGEVVIGHNTPRKGLVIDSSIDRSIVAGQDYKLKITLDGTTVSVELDNQIVLGHAFNAVVVDGAYGLYSHGGDASFNTFTVQTDDRAYEGYLDEAEELLITNEVAGNKGLFRCQSPEERIAEMSRGIIFKRRRETDCAVRGSHFGTAVPNGASMLHLRELWVLR